ncbi:MAG: hypothetical protein Q8Q33_00970, partial [Chlamydiota bacterium]|nr:hypothetical protein [Chlamydiota bacterium]
MKDLELLSAKKNQICLAQDLESLLIKLNSTKDLKDSTLKEYEVVKTELGNIQRSYDNNVDQMSVLEQQIIKISGDIDRRKQESVHINESLAQLHQRLENDHQEISISKERLQRYQTQMESENERVQTFQEDYHKQDEGLIQKQQNIQDVLKEIELGERQRDELKSRIMDLSNQASMTKNLRSSLAEKMRMQLLRLEKVKTEQDRVKELLETKQTQTKQIEATLEQMNGQLRSVQSLLEDLGLKKSQKRSLSEVCSHEYETLKTKINQERFRHEILHRPHQTKTIEYIRGLMQRNNVLEGMESGGYEILDQALCVPELYKRALFSVLGDKHTAVLVASWDSMKDLFSRLEASERGGIHYLCYGQQNLMPPISEDTKSLEGVLGFLKDHISFEARFQHAVDLLLGDVILVRDLQVLTELAKNKKENFRAVSVQGDYLDRDGVITCAQIDETIMSFEPGQ